MSLYVVGSSISIIQLQGLFAIDLPRSLRNWPKLFVEACQQWAIEKNFKQVRISKACSLSSYPKPSIPGAKTQAELCKAQEAVQSRMLTRYDGTARELGFADRRNWFVWKNPGYCRFGTARRPWARLFHKGSYDEH
jgi:hypothetical protein